MEKTIEIRAHHLLCIPRFYRGGYDKKFAENMKEVCMLIRKNPNTKIRILVGKLDILCKECPHKEGHECMQTEEIGKWVKMHDKRVAKLLGIKFDSVHNARDVFNLSMEKVNNEAIKDVCIGCIFLENCIKVGINNSFRKDLNRNIY
ncbi:DUF1284 domain-containing protein [Candidatus Woesearchaeota archaeon]|nr:DUF1284 domain-containing protein [Candidatus Woesearchaeota archaeon]